MSTPANDNKSEIRKLGAGERIDHAKLWEEMEEDRLDKAIATTRAHARKAQQPKDGGEPPAAAAGA